MFESEKASLSALEARARAALNEPQAKIASLRREIETLDSGILTAFTRVEALVRGAQGKVTTTLSPLRARIQQLTPKDP